MLFVYDDSGAIPPSIRQMIGADRFGDVLSRKRHLADIVEDVVLNCGTMMHFVRIGSAGERRALIERLERLPDDTPIFRLPSSLMPSDRERFSATLRKLPYALGAAAFGARFDDEQVALLPPADLVRLLTIEDVSERRAFFGTFGDTALQVADVMGVTDLRQIGAFLAYMSGATEARHFNAVNIVDGVFRKSSSDVAKMRGEYRYFHVVPEPMRRFLIPTFGWEEADGRASYAMEHLAVPDAAIQIVHDSFDPVSFALLLDRFFDFLRTRATVRADRETVRGAARSAALEKTARRLSDLLETDIGRRLDALMAASGPYGGITAMEAHARILIERCLDTDKYEEMAVSHGDPCLSNILFNRDIGLFRLIDPRGATSMEEALLHPLYDVAKFSHSILGGYDFINNGLFETQVDDTLQLRLMLDNGGPPDWMRAAFLARLQAEGYEPRLVRAFELSLFLSMLPLHVDVPRKLPAFCLTACIIMRELEDAL